MYKTHQFKITNEDNMKLMSDCPDNYFDLAIVDPPYGINASKMTMGRGSGNDKKKHDTSKIWDNSIPCEKYFIELNRVSKNQIIWGGNYFINYLSNTRCFLLWDKKDYNSDFASHELAWTSFDRNTKCFIRARSAGGDSKNKIHPTQKPIALYQWLLKNYAKPNQRILDTHLGSGSIAIAIDSMNKIEKMNLHLTACELDKEYYDKSIERIKDKTSWQSLF